MKRTSLQKNTNTDGQNSCEFHQAEILSIDKFSDPKDIQQVRSFVRMKYRFVIVVFSLLFLIGACKNSQSVKIGFLMPDGEGSRWPIDKGYVEAAAKEKGVEVVTMFVKADENMQIRQASEMLELGIDVLIIVPVNSNTAAAIVRDAHNYNVPVISYDRLIKNSDLDYLVTFEGAQIGNIMVEHALQIVPKGNYVLLYGDPSDNNAIFIKDAQEAMLKPYVDRGDINIVYKGFIDNWSMANAYHTMSKVLSFTDQKIDAVITSYDGLAMGALRALKEYPDQNIKVLTGQDAELDAIKAIVNNEMSLTVYKSIREIANASVDLAAKLARGERVDYVKATVNNGRKDVPSLMLTPVAVQKNTIRTTVIADKYFTEEQVYGIER